MIRRLALLAVSAALTLAACTSGTPETPPPGSGGFSPAAPATASPSLASPVATAGQPIAVSDPKQVTGQGELAGKHCHFTGTPPYQLPDPSCTPGSYDPHIGPAVICAKDAHGHYTYNTGTYRPPTYQTSRAKYEIAYPAYGLPTDKPAEFDHLDPLLIGGSNDLANLWPQQPAPGKPIAPNIKDRTELALRTWICSAPAGEQRGRQLAALQEIARDWITALDVLGVPHKDIPAAGKTDVALAA
jgi:hypothetical protein